MATEDLSRSAFYSSKHYAGVRMQQGRVLTDDDYNEGARIHEEERRLARIHVIGPYGSPDKGFHITNPTNVGGWINFDVNAGHFYLGGLQLHLDNDTALQEQRDWLCNPGVEGPTKEGERYDLVYLEAWQQPVSAVEDGELFEAALGGSDTSTRLRNMCRVRVQPGVVETGADDAEKCKMAWNVVVARWKANGDGELNPIDHELASGARLRVGYTPLTVEPADLCTSPGIEKERYLGAENQAIRVQLVDRDHFTWGFDNRAPLYRVEVSGNQVTMLTQPKDLDHWPKAGQIVEILPWSAELANGEKLAEELEPGHLCKVAGSYDPESDRILLSDDLPTDFGRVSRSETRPEYVYLRIWDRGADHSSEPKIPISADIPLGYTGLTISISGEHRRASDYWIIATRPETPNRVVPWELQEAQGRLPHGVRRFRAPLALLQWNSDDPSGNACEVIDCRRTFDPLPTCYPATGNGNGPGKNGAGSGLCCSKTVGGPSSFQTIQAAIDDLPNTGGEICVLPGKYKENVEISGKGHMSIRGCGGTVEISSDSSQAVFSIVDCHDIRIEGLAVIASGNGAGVFMESLSQDVFNVTLADLSVTASRRSAIELRSGGGHLVREVTISGSRIRMEDLAGAWPGIFVMGEDVLIEDNNIIVSSTPTSAARGGLQIGGTSERIRVIDNLIQGGIGNGITLGSLQEVDSEHKVVKYVVASIVDDDNSGVPADAFIRMDDRLFQSPGFLYDIHIERNRILDMGLNGIGMVGFFGVQEVAESDTVVGLTIIDNEIRGCLQRELSSIDDALIDSMGYGAIALADVESLRIHHNVIEDNGIDDPINGIFVLMGEGIEISANRILHSVGPTGQSQNGASGGRCGGISIVYAITPMVSIGIVFDIESPRQNGMPALTAHNNSVSVQRGPALAVTALGPVSVCGNQFTTRGLPTRANPTSRRSSFIGSTVAIVNLGVSNELYGQLVLFSALRLGRFRFASLGLNLIDDFLHMVIPMPHILHLGEVGQYLANGNILFTNNQCTLDLLETGLSFSMSSIYILSLDDVVFHANQCDCSVLDDVVISQVIILGFSLRVSDNRFKEGLANTPFSAFTFGLMNMTTNNQSTHCLIVLPPSVSPYTT